MLKYLDLLFTKWSWYFTAKNNTGASEPGEGEGLLASFRFFGKNFKICIYLDL